MSTEARFTPGPWRWLDGNNLMGDHGKRPIILSAQKLYARKPDGMMRPNEIDSPNARLIAAAPALYEALSDVLNDFRSLSKEPSVKVARTKAQAAYEKVRAALKLAQGETR